MWVYEDGAGLPICSAVAHCDLSRYPCQRIFCWLAGTSGHSIFSFCTADYSAQRSECTLSLLGDNVPRDEIRENAFTQAST